MANKTIDIKDENNNNMYVNSVGLSSESSSNGVIKFGVDANGNYGYVKDGADSVTPFNSLTSLQKVAGGIINTSSSVNVTINTSCNYILSTCMRFTDTSGRSSQWLIVRGTIVSHVSQGTYYITVSLSGTTLTITNTNTGVTNEYMLSRIN